MGTAKRWAFDVPVDGIDEKPMTMSELMKAYHFCKNTEPERANEILLYAVQSDYIPAKFEYSKFLRCVPILKMPQKERYKKAETLLLELLNLVEVSDKFIANVAFELGTLYADCLRRPVGALSLFLYAKRMGADVEQYRLTELQRKLEIMDINQLGNNSVDSLRLGQELHYVGSTPKLTEFFLREAADKAAVEMNKGKRGARMLYARACLALGDFYDDMISVCSQHEKTFYNVERDKLYIEARKYGYPEYLCFNHPVR